MKRSHEIFGSARMKTEYTKVVRSTPWRWLVPVCLLLLLSACGQQKVKPSPPVQPVKPVVVEQPQVIPPAPPKKAEVKPPPEVLILLSSPAKAYQQVSRYLSTALAGHTTEIILSGQPAQDSAMIRDIRASDTRQIVAIGLKAARSVKSITNKQIIFAQVTNYRDYNLVSGNMKGVSALPSPEKLFKDWKALAPSLSRVAVVVGKNLDPYLDRARKAARAWGIELIVRQVATDKEFIYRSKHLKPDIEGQWIIPDNRVLSGKALKEVMAYGSRRGRQIVVFTPRLLSFGGFFYVQPDAEAIARVILQRLSAAESKRNIPGKAVQPVMTHIMGINQNIARQLNLEIPPNYRKYINAE